MRYDEFVERVLRQVVAGYEQSPYSYGLHALSTDLGFGAWGDFANDPERRAQQLALNSVLDDLQERWLLLSQSTQLLEPSLEARRLVAGAIIDIYPTLRAGHLTADQDAYVREVASKSHVEHDDFAEVLDVTPEGIFQGLGWAWDDARYRRIVRDTDGQAFTHTRMYGGGDDQVRIRWSGFIRVMDEVGRVLPAPESPHHPSGPTGGG